MGCSSSSQAQVSRYQNTAKAKVKAFQAVVSIENTSMCVFNFFLFHICWIFPLSASIFLLFDFFKIFFLKMEIHYQDYYEVTKSRNTLFIIDPQNDFHPGGSLAIPTANEDSSRISKLIMEHGDQIDDIIVSLDSHQKLHIAHSLFWVNAAGEHPPPFTPIPLAAVENGEWKTSQPKWQDWGLAYVKQLEANKRFTLLIWPEVHSQNQRPPLPSSPYILRMF
jgi:hypothetical protein